MHQHTQSIEYDCESTWFALTLDGQVIALARTYRDGAITLDEVISDLDGCPCRSPLITSLEPLPLLDSPTELYPPSAASRAALASETRTEVL